MLSVNGRSSDKTASMEEEKTEDRNTNHRVDVQQQSAAKAGQRSVKETGDGMAIIVTI